ncbi:uncharacterized protein LOC118486418 [Helianthus annuus]|uniref:uncharacterized protein LOC118486418 n=1 Tax=Helianthus annuus TaxID=4232 RepID=UPI001652CE5A|nr:uncharacterized protein LOC118486418 [Helianthus annuus]
MNFLSLNIRGLGEGVKNKAGWVKEIKRENGIDFMALQEIQFSDISGIEFEKFWGTGKFEMDHVPAVGRSGGVVSLWDPSVFKVHDSIKHPNFLLTMGVIKGINRAINIINVYAPQKVPLKKALWEDIGVVLGSYTGWWVIMGDFNAVRFMEEKRNSNFNKNCASNFNEFIFENGLIEYDLKGRKFTYHKDNSNKQSKIDRFLVCHDFFNAWPVACLRELPRVHSDHCPLVLSCSDKNFGPKPFRFFNSWLERKDFDEVVQKANDSFIGNGEPEVVLMHKFKVIREDIKKWKKKDEVSEERKLLEEEEWSKVECLKDLRELEGYKIKDLKQRARIRWDLEGDENSAFFHGYINSRRALNNIPGLMVDGKWISKPSLVKREIMHFFKKAFEEKTKDRPRLNCHIIRRLSEEDAAILTVPFRNEEIKSAVKGTIEAGCSSSFITLIPKSKDPVGLRDYRPINLIGVISKTISKILANRLKKAYDNVNWSFLLDIMDQMGFPNLWWLEGVLKGIQTPNNGPVISHLLYADDALLIGNWDRENVVNVARCLRIFYLCSGLKINLLKSNLYGLGVDNSEITEMAKVIGCNTGNIPLTYLGITVGANMNRINSWNPIIEVFNKRVADRVQGNEGFSWHWSRLPESDDELKEWLECLEVLNMVRLFNDKDSWYWNDGSQDSFSVKSVKKALIIERGHCHLPNFVWCKWVPLKCNVMAWRGNLDRLATRVNLRRRNVDITSVLCPFYEEYEETVEHLFTACLVANRVWAAFSTWCNIPPIFAFDFKDILDTHNHIQAGKKSKKIIYGLSKLPFCSM